ncbi:sulfatase, partial [bacterium]|nr:sulfatase [bacterium]
VLTKSGHLNREALFWHFPHYRGRGVVPYSIIRAGEWKLIKRYEGKTFELYNLNDDIEEKFDLADKMKDKVNNLDLELTKWLKGAGAKIPKENPNYKPNSKKNN